MPVRPDAHLSSRLQKKALPPLVYYPRNQVQDDLDEKEVWRELRTPHGQPDNRIEWLEESVRRGEEELKDLKEGSEACEWWAGGARRRS